MTTASAPSGDTTGATDTANLQADLNAIPSSGGALYLQRGTYYITGLTVPSPTTIIGEGCGDEDFMAAATRIVGLSPTGVTIAIPDTARGCNFQRFALVYGGTGTPTGGAGFAFTSTHAGQSVRMIDLFVRGFWINVDWRYGQDWHMSRCSIFDPVQYGIRIQNSDNPGGGDMSITDCMLYSGTTNKYPAAMVRYESGGGLRFIGNKINQDVSGGPTIGLDMAILDGYTDSDCLIVGNSIENYTQAGIKVHLRGPNNTGVWYNVLITHNQFYTGFGATTSVAIAPEVSGRLQSVLCSDNIFELDNGGTAYRLQNVDQIVIGPYTGRNITTGLSIGPNVTNFTQIGLPATPAASGVVKIDEPSADPTAITVAGYLSSLTGLTARNLSLSAGITGSQLSASAGIAGSQLSPHAGIAGTQLDPAADVLLSQLGQSGAAVGQIAQWNGSSWVPASVSLPAAGAYAPLVDTSGDPLSFLQDNTGDIIVAPD